MGFFLVVMLIFILLCQIPLIIIPLCSSGKLNIWGVIVFLIVDLFLIFLSQIIRYSSAICVHYNENKLKCFYLIPKAYEIPFSEKSKIYFEKIIYTVRVDALEPIFIIYHDSSINLYDTLLIEKVKYRGGYNIDDKECTDSKIESKEYVLFFGGYGCFGQANYCFLRQFVPFENFITKDKELKIKLEKMEEKYQKKYGD